MMQKDFKIGLGIGLLLAIATLIWLSTLPNLSTQARALQSAHHAAPAITEKVDGHSNISPPHPYQPAASSLILPPKSFESQPQTVTIEKTPRIHIVQKGDTLSAISSKYYGSPHYWQKILSANRANLTDPNHLTPSTRLIIPE
jgi:nucleoid-associated protein YgaU